MGLSRGMLFDAVIIGICVLIATIFTQESLEIEMIRKDSGGSCDLERIRGREGQPSKDNSSHQGWRVYTMCKHFDIHASCHLKQVMRFTVS